MCTNSSSGCWKLRQKPLFLYATIVGLTLIQLLQCGRCSRVEAVADGGCMNCTVYCKGATITRNVLAPVALMAASVKVSAASFSFKCTTPWMQDFLGIRIQPRQITVPKVFLDLHNLNFNVVFALGRAVRLHDCAPHRINS